MEIHTETTDSGRVFLIACRDRGVAPSDGRHETPSVHRRHGVVIGLPRELRARHRVPRSRRTPPPPAAVCRPEPQWLPPPAVRRPSRVTANTVTVMVPEAGPRARRDRGRPVTRRHHQTRAVHRRHRGGAARPAHRGSRHHLPVLVSHLRRQLFGRAQGVQFGRGRAHRHGRWTGGLWRRRRGGAVIAAAGPCQGYTRPALRTAG